jgi:hypothetical protein
MPSALRKLLNSLLSFKPVSHPETVFSDGNSQTTRVFCHAQKEKRFPMFTSKIPVFTLKGLLRTPGFDHFLDS